MGLGGRGYVSSTLYARLTERENLCRIWLVDQPSATLHGKRLISLTTDHSGLNKFHDPEDGNCCLVWPEIQRMVQTAPSKIEAR